MREPPALEVKESDMFNPKLVPAEAHLDSLGFSATLPIDADAWRKFAQACGIEVDDLSDDVIAFSSVAAGKNPQAGDWCLGATLLPHRDKYRVEFKLFRAPDSDPPESSVREVAEFWTQVIAAWPGSRTFKGVLTASLAPPAIPTKLAEAVRDDPESISALGLVSELTVRGWKVSSHDPITFLLLSSSPKATRLDCRGEIELTIEATLFDHLETRLCPALSSLIL